MNPIDLDAIRARNAERRKLKDAATPAPWTRAWEHETEIQIRAMAPDAVPINIFQHRLICTINRKWAGNDPDSDANTDFVAAARGDPVEDDVDALVAEVVRLRAQLPGPYCPACGCMI
jgi:hypothetical protein